MTGPQDKKGANSSILKSVWQKFSSKQAKAEELYRSGKLGALRQERFKQGAPPWAILRYKHVINPEERPLPIRQDSFITPETFERHLIYLSTFCSPIPLATLVKRILLGQKIEEQTVALTFDGGHLDFLINAAPLLLKYNVPATLCVPTWFISSETFFLEDRIAFALMAMLEAKKPLPEFDFLDPEEYQTLRQISPQLELSGLLIGSFIDVLRRASEKQRWRVLQAFAANFQEILPLPNYQDFLTWEQLKLLHEKGVTVATMGHAHVMAHAIASDKFLEDVLQSLERLLEAKISPEKLFCFVEGGFTNSTLNVLQDLGFRCVLSLGSPPDLKAVFPEMHVLGRVRVFQDIAPTEALLTCQMWNINLE